MADKIRLDKIEINDANAQAILKGNQVLMDLLRRGASAAAAASAASDGDAEFFVDRTSWSARNAVYVTTGNHAARKGEATNRALTRALDSAR